MGATMKNPLDTLPGTVIAGLVIATALAAGITFNENLGSLTRFVHIVAGVMWIGLLWYFNFVQVPALAEAGADKSGPGGAGITKYVAPRALFYFRWAAILTWLAGFGLLAQSGQLGAFALGLLGQSGGDMPNPYQMVIGFGAWFGTIMLFNVWVLIWPNQKKILGLVPASDEEKAKARRIAFLASRTNTMLSIPMLLCMGSAGHGLPF
jgi:uncharacterized membrane protein